MSFQSSFPAREKKNLDEQLCGRGPLREGWHVALAVVAAPEGDGRAVAPHEHGVGLAGGRGHVAATGRQGRHAALAGRVRADGDALAVRPGLQKKIYLSLQYFSISTY